MTDDVTLNLLDLVHGLTPEPQLPRQHNQQWPEEDQVPAVDEEEMARIRMRVSEFSSIREILSDREKELIEFVCSLHSISHFPRSIYPSIRSRGY